MHNHTPASSGDSTQLIYLRARYYAPAAGRFLTRDTWLGDYNGPLSLNRWIYVLGNPINFVDPSGHNWRHPTAQEGTAIHEMIGEDFDEWGDLMGRLVDEEVEILSASKTNVPYIRTPDGGLVRRPRPDNDDQNPGFADLLDFTIASVYEIKHHPSWQYAIADARWYQYHLNNDIDFVAYGPWSLGVEYLADYGNAGKFIDFWPNDPNHVVVAKWQAAGAITYWAKEPNDLRERNFENADEYARFLAMLAAAGLLGGIAGDTARNRRQPEGVLREDIDIFDFLANLCRNLSSMESPTGPILIPVVGP